MEYPSISEEDLHCPICADFFIEPKLLPCAHRLCASCLGDYVKFSKTDDCRCPLCQKHFRRKAVFPTDHVLRNLVQDRIVLPLGKCKVHVLQRTRYCHSCSMLVCAECIIDKHRECSTVVPVAEAKETMEEKFHKEKERIDALERIIDSAEEQSTKKIEETRSVTTDAFDHLEKVKEEFVTHIVNMQDALKEHENENVTQLQNYLTMVKKLKTKMLDLNTSVKKSLDNKSADGLFEAMNTVEERQGFLGTISHQLEEGVEVQVPSLKLFVKSPTDFPYAKIVLNNDNFHYRKHWSAWNVVRGFVPDTVMMVHIATIIYAICMLTYYFLWNDKNGFEIPYICPISLADACPNLETYGLELYLKYDETCCSSDGTLDIS
ncbi:E3 ubiquitin-protein ligase TRIM13-like [Haliotis rufescens]|uniref:E3 ubiquitin-protein ligase TRIM13-like n=1 Tax=Haliotis rufescens TaxID=6454 RepID=UPI00201F0E22|nr:E3 ubiquitin-protein ligase TRIM13-like [Haliotis rufescens]XP_046334005.2 E3 ubiquitin-protein ligase TRIM13-like [Haliotis rufescens]